MKTVSLRQLTSSCIYAGWQGCEVIRSFHQAHQDAKGGSLKIGGDPRSVVTQCDVDAQAKIIGGLRESWGDDLLIIGEEEDDGNEAPQQLLGTESRRLRTDLLDEVLPLDLDEAIPLNELVVFVDPVDGTREFVEGRLRNVACLIGIARNSRPIAGVIGVPFPDGVAAGAAEIHYAVADQTNLAGVWPSQMEPPAASLASSSDGATTVWTGDSSNPILKKATQCACSILATQQGTVHHSIVGGTAAKLRLVATSTTPALSILHFDTELWDTCAAEALLKSKGGKVTDLFGSPLVHSPHRKFGNVFGVVASSVGASEVHNELCQKMRGDNESVHAVFKRWMGDDDPPVSPQAIDVARDLDGIPYGLKDLQELLRNENPANAKLLGYSVPEESAWRGLMSNGVRYHLKWERNETHKSPDCPPPTDVFYKRIVMGNLDYAQDKLKIAPHKLVRDVRSYQVEASFLTSAACRDLVGDTGMKINKVIASDLRPISGDNPKELLDSSFSLLLEYFQRSDGWGQRWLLQRKEVEASLSELAKLHAYFWHGSDFWKKDGGTVASDLEALVWPNGGYMQPKLQGYDQLKKVRSGWEARYPTFQEDLRMIKELEGVDLRSLGQRLEEIASEVGRQSHPFSVDGTKENDLERYRTLIHGDPKHANFFFRRKQNPFSEEDKIEVGVIDFQWSGFGLAATDVAHHIASAVSSSALSLNGKAEAELLDHYHSCLSKELVSFGVARNEEEIEELIFPRQILQEQYEVAFLDVCRIVFAYSWRRWKAEDEPTEESFNRNAYNKSLDSVLWLITRCHVLLDRYKQRS